MKNKNMNIPLTQSSFVDCGKSIKEEDIKEEIKEEVERIDDSLPIQQKIENSNGSVYIKGEIKYEKNFEVTSF